MPVSLPTIDHPAIRHAESRSTTIATGLLITWAAAMLLTHAVARFALDTAAMDTFELIAGF